MRKKAIASIFTLSLLFLMSCGAGKEKTDTNNTSDAQSGNTTSSKTGAEMYSSKCTACHGSDGNMGVAGAKKIPESVLSQEEREGLIKNGKGTMPAFKDQLNHEEIKKVAEYTLTLK